VAGLDGAGEGYGMTRAAWIAKFEKIWGRKPTPKEIRHEAPKE
jgi:hypothetical protein